MDKFINQLTEKTAPVSTDLILIWDTAGSATKYAQKGNLVGTFTKETPSGAFNGSNVTYTLAQVPLANSLDLVLNGQVLTEGVDYSIGGLSGKTITMTSAIDAGYTGPFIAKYQY